MGNRSIRIQSDTQENLSDEQMAKLMSFVNKYGWFTFSASSKIEPDYIANLPPLPLEKDERSPGNRLRSVLYVFYEQKGKPGGSFETFYRDQMEKFIEFVKEKLS